MKVTFHAIQVHLLILISIFFRKPPNKRVNYRKLRVPSPFLCQWTELLMDWLDCEAISEFYVLRERKKLETLNAMLHHGYKKKNKITNVLRQEDFTPEELRCLVPISITMLWKGRPCDMAIIALPEDNDCKRVRNKMPGHVEQAGNDSNKHERKELRQQHKLLLKRLRRRRKRGNISADSKDIIDSHAETMQTLWLPDKTISASRRTMGWVAKGDYSLSVAAGRGVGFVALPALLALASTRNVPKVLIRNTTSLQYSFAHLEVRML